MARTPYTSLQHMKEFEEFLKNQKGEPWVFMADWMRDLKAWGEEVRDDIIRLECAVGTQHGDPGAPPPAPRK